jgi:hypothetical protein
LTKISCSKPLCFVTRIATSLICLILALANVAVAQKSSLKVIAEFPLHFGIGYEGQVYKRFSAGGSVGVLTSPHSDLIITWLRFIGTEEELVLIIEDAFKLGVVGEVNVNFNIQRHYIGTFFQAIGAKAGDASAELIADYFDVNLQDYPLKPGGSSAPERNLTCRTRLYQLGLLYGYRFPFKDNRFEIDVEAGLSLNVGSKSSVYSDNRDFSQLNERLNVELQGFYKDYAYIPSVGVMFVYRFARARD